MEKAQGREKSGVKVCVTFSSSSSSSHPPAMQSPIFGKCQDRRRKDVLAENKRIRQLPSAYALLGDLLTKAGFGQTQFKTSS
jgi:hypothetical protein